MFYMVQSDNGRYHKLDAPYYLRVHSTSRTINVDKRTSDISGNTLSYKSEIQLLLAIIDSTAYYGSIQISNQFSSVHICG